MLLLPFAALALSACASGEPKRVVAPHPIGGMQDRVRSRIDRIELIVDDAKRRRQVIAVYQQLERLLWQYQDSRGALGRELLFRAMDGIGTEAEILGLMEARKGAEARFFEHYVELQLKLRELLTEREFARIDALR
jgi:hypothetical protein